CQDGNDKVRADAFYLARRKGTGLPPGLLLQGLRDPLAVVRLYTLLLLVGRIKEPDMAAVLPLLHDRDAHVADVSISVLCQSRDVRILERVVRAVRRNKERDFNSDVEHALANAGPPARLLVKSLLADKEARMRRLAVPAIFKTLGSEAMDTLQTLF